MLNSTGWIRLIKLKGEVIMQQRQQKREGLKREKGADAHFIKNNKNTQIHVHNIERNFQCGK